MSRDFVIGGVCFLGPGFSPLGCPCLFGLIVSSRISSPVSLLRMITWRLFMSIRTGVPACSFPMLMWWSFPPLRRVTLPVL